MIIRVLSFLILLLTTSFFQSKPKLKAKDLKIALGSWSGKLTYLDYSSNKKTSIPADLLVTASGADKNVFYFSNIYPKEPQENSIDTITISKDGGSFDGEIITDLFRIKSDSIKMITEKTVNDNGIEKLYRYTYGISKQYFSIKKEEQRKGKDDLIERNRYEFRRN